MRALKITPTITRRDEKSLEKYLQEISKYDVLSPEEEYTLFTQRAVDRDEALRKIVQHNLRFVVSVAKKYQDCGLPLSDLINEGNLGLMKAAERFDESRGFKFISYAVWWIRQSIIAAINEKGRKIRTPLNLQGIYNKIQMKRSEFLQIHEREPTHQELADELELSVEVLRRAMSRSDKCVSLDRPAGHDSDASIGQLMEDDSLGSPDEDLVGEDSQREEISTLLRTLPPRQAHIIKSYYGIGQRFPKTLTDIADDLNISRERARQIRDRCLRQLRRKGSHLVVER